MFGREGSVCAAINSRAADDVSKAPWSILLLKYVRHTYLMIVLHTVSPHKSAYHTKHVGFVRPSAKKASAEASNAFDSIGLTE